MLYYHPIKLFRCFSSVWCVTPILLLGQLELFFKNLKMKYPWNRGRHVWLMLLKQVLARLRCLVAFMKATNLLHRVMRAIEPAHRDGHQNGQQSGYILHNRCVDCRPGGRQGDTKWVVARWRRSVASVEALVMLHWGCAPYCIGTPPWLSKWPATEVHLFAVAAYFDWCSRS